MNTPRKGLTPLQIQTLAIGCKNTAAELGEDGETYRHRILREELGLESFKQMNSTTDFDKMMQRIWVDRGDYSRALQYTGGNTNRLRYLATESAKKVTGSDDEKTVCKYVAGVMIQMKFSALDLDSLTLKLRRVDGWDDFTDNQLRKVISALQAYIRRHA